jgi:hypothetical protein
MQQVKVLGKYNRQRLEINLKKGKDKVIRVQVVEALRVSRG